MEHIKEFLISEDAIKKLKNPKLVHKELAQGKTFQEIIGYSAETMEKFYLTAYSLYQEQRYVDCAEAFTFLTTLNPYIHNYWLGLAMSEHMKEDYERALIAYGMAIFIEIENPFPHYHSAFCYIKLQDHDNALASLELAIQYASDVAEHQHLKQKAIAARKRLSAEG